MYNVIMKSIKFEWDASKIVQISRNMASLSRRLTRTIITKEDYKNERGIQYQRVEPKEKPLF